MKAFRISPLAVAAAGVAALVLASPLSAPTASAQVQPTVEGAHAFLVQMLPNSGAYIDASHSIDDDGEFDSADRIAIDAVYSYGCQTTISARSRTPGKHPKRIIDWTRATDAWQDGGRVVVNGPIKLGDGSVEANLGIYSVTPADRVAKAMKFLVTACNKASATGF